MTNELQVQESGNLMPADATPASEGLFLDVQAFNHAQRVAKMLASSTMVPEQFRNNVGNCMIALNFAARTRLDPAMVMQKMYIIKGRPGIEGQLVIALINNSNRFSPLQFRFSGEGKTRQCTAFATDLQSGQACEQTVTWKMVEAEGWNKKQGSKWLTMPDLMFQYRAAAFFGRLYCPEVLLGMMTKEELHDIDGQRQAPVASLADRLPKAVTKTIPETSETIDVEPKPNPLHDTIEWKEWVEVKEIFPEVVESWQDPSNTQQCIEAVAQVKQIVDGQSA